MVYLVDSRGMQVAIDSWIVALFIALVAVFLIGFYLLRSFGVYKLSKAQNLSCAYMAFIPGMWMYPACKLCGNSRFFRTTIERVALVFAIIFSVSVLLNFAYNLILYIPLLGYYLGGGEKIIISESVNIVGAYEYITGVYLGGDFVDPYTSILAYRLITSLRWIMGIMTALGEVVSIFMFCAIFRKYWPEYFLVSVICSLIGLFPVFIFIIRKKSPIDYNEFVRRRVEQYRNPYGPDPYGNNSSQNRSKPSEPDDPFSDFDKKDSNDDPFSDFDK